MATEARDTDKDWERIASEEPYWGVLSDDDYRGRPSDPTRWLASKQPAKSSLPMSLR